MALLSQRSGIALVRTSAGRWVGALALLSTATLLLGCSDGRDATPPPAQSTSALDLAASDDVRFLADVPGQFRALTERPDALGFHIGSTPNPSSCRHYQGIARVEGADGTPFFLVTRSGNTPEIPGPNELLCDDSPHEKRNGNLIVFRMGSRDKNGERLRSNRLRKGAHVDATEPPTEDTASIYFTVVEGGLVFRGDDDPLLPKVYQHPGGMQVVGHVMAVASETPRPYPNDCAACFITPNPPDACDVCFNYERASAPTLVQFFDVSDPEAPVWTSQFVPVDQDGDALPGADGIAVTRLPRVPEEAAARYLMTVTGGFEVGDPFYFYRSSPGALDSPDLTWELVAQPNGPTGLDDAHQSLHFLREGNIDGALYLAGARGHAVVGPLFEDHDRIDLYRVECDTPYCVPGELVHITTRYNGRRLTPRPSTGGKALASLAAATGFHETPSGELLFYATDHDNIGPGGTAVVGEWRNIDMVRENSPTLLPTARPGGPYAVDEGGSVSLAGSAEPPITRTWIELFHEPNYGGTDFSTFYPVVDFNDYDLDNFDDFAALERQVILDPFSQPPTTTIFSHADKARSWKWYAPVGCSILALDHQGGTLDEARTLAGTGRVEQAPDLSDVLNDGGTDDINQEIDAVRFLPNCTEYYATPVSLKWDLDLDGNAETTGAAVTFDAAALDGPNVIEIPVNAQHPAGGAPGVAHATVTVNNVAPRLAPVVLTDGGGNVINVAVPFVLVGLPLTLSASFTDPGLPDHQTASLDWGDGSIQAQSAFASFDEAFGDGSGAVLHRHVYTSPGQLDIHLAVTDDDGGVSSQAASVTVLTAEQAVEALVDMLQDAIAATGDARLRKHLEKALKALTGNPNGNNGALDKIRNGNEAAAEAFLRQARQALETAQAGGANVASLIALIDQVILALSA